MKKFFLYFLILLISLSSLSCSINKLAYKFNTKNIKIALVLPGSINDGLWNEAAYNGLKRFEEDHKKVDIAIVEKIDLQDAKEIFSRLGEKKFDLVIGYNYNYGFVVKKIARMYPDTFFCVINNEISQEPNLCSFNFKDEQYGYLLGIVAGINTSTNKVGIVVAKKLPFIEEVILGMRKGLRSTNPKADLIVSYINTKNDIGKGREAGVAQINNGVDVITHLAGIAGIGVIKAAEDADISAIGAIVDQHDLAPSTVITSVLEDASQLIYLVCEHYFEQSLKPKAYHFGLKDQLIDITPSYGNIDPTVETRINRIKSMLIDLEAEQEEEPIRKKNSN